MATPGSGRMISSGSWTIDKAAHTDVRTDIDGDPRPIGPAADIGADEARRRMFLRLALRNCRTLSVTKRPPNAF
jgi:hypothetical protein